MGKPGLVARWEENSIWFNLSGWPSDIYVMNADGTNPVLLTNQEVSNGNPVWSPDSTKIAFDSSRDGNSEIYVINADGSNLVRLTDNDANDYAPAWSP